MNQVIDSNCFSPLFYLYLLLQLLLSTIQMKEDSELGYMDCDTLSSSCQLEENGGEKISVTDHISRLQHSVTKPESFIVDMERFSHLTSKDITPNSRITLQRNFSRKGSQKKINSSIENERDPSSMMPTSSSPRASLLGTSTPEKPTLVAVGATINNPQLHNQITISTVKDAATPTTTPTKRSLITIKRSSPSRTIDPRRILFIFATLSSMGSILLIYFTLCIGKFGGEENALNS